MGLNPRELNFSVTPYNWCCSLVIHSFCWL